MKNIRLLVFIIIPVLIAIIIFLIYHFNYQSEPKKNYGITLGKSYDFECPEFPALRYGIFSGFFDEEEYIIRENESLSQILYGLGANAGDIEKVSALTSDEFDVRSIRSGYTCRAFYTKDTTRSLCYFVYEKSPLAYSVFCFRDSFSVKNGQRKVEIRTCQTEAEITSSLWNATADKGIDPNLSLRLSDIYAWTIDFFGLQKGDRFSVLYDELYVDSACVGIGNIHACKFIHVGKDHYAVYFEQDSVGDYWDEAGNSLKRAFLKAPLQFSRISSHFTYSRKHPVLKIVRPHTGVDYAAPSGTPVMSIGEGTVVERSYQRGGGNTVKIKHNSVYSTAYLHLSKFGKDIKPGCRVRQGQVIGYVGSTGLSTGPHLDFRVWKNGTPINPLTMESPPTDPVRPEFKPVFDSISQFYLKQLGPI